MRAARGVTASLLAALLVAPLVAAGAETKVAVIAVGNDPATVGLLQRSLEVRLRTMPQLAVRDAADIVPTIAVKTAPSASYDPVVQRKATELTDAASRAYYEDKLVDALDKLAAVAALYERAVRVPTGDRVRLLLWRTAVLLALNDRDKAEAEARAALVLAPDLKVDANVFRPSVVKLVDEIRRRGLPSGTLLLSGLPPDAEVRVDDRLVQGERVTVPHGRHRVAIRALGFHEVERTVDVGGDTAVPLGMPMALDPALERAVSAAVFRGDAGDARPTLERLVERLGVDVVVLAGTRTEPTESRGMLFHRSGPPVAAGPFAATDAMVDWAARSLITVTPEPTPARAPVAIASPRPTARPVATPLPQRGPRPRLPIAAAGGVAIVSRERSVKGGGGFTSAFVGAGPRARLDVGNLGPFGAVDASFVSYGMSRLDVNLPDDSRTTVDGGSTLDVRAGGGWRVGLGGGDPKGPAIAIGAFGFFESHAGNDLEDSSGSLGIFPSQQRQGLEVRVGGSAPAGPVSLLAELGVIPFSQLTETPADTTGESPRTALSPVWRLGAVWDAVPGLAVSAEYAGEMRSVSFTGQGRAPLNPPVEDAKVTETLHGFTVSVRKAF